MSDKCIFCKIINNQSPSVKLYEDEFCIAIADIFPSKLGHFLVMPKEHYETVFDMPSDLYGNVAASVARICKAFKAYDTSVGVNIVQNNGEVAGQVVNHVHFHIIPQYDHDKKPIKIDVGDFDESNTLQLIDNIKKFLA